MEDSFRFLEDPFKFIEENEGKKKSLNNLYCSKKESCMIYNFI